MGSHVIRARIQKPGAGAQIARGTVLVTGWVFDESELLETVMLVVDDGPGTPVRLGVWSPDAAEAHPSVPHAAASGFEATVDLRAASGDAARIALLVRTRGGEWTEAAAVDVKTKPPVRGRDGARPRAAFTIVQNESAMLPVWLDYYNRYFDPGDVFVLDHGSLDGSTVGLETLCRVVPVHRTASFDHNWLRSTVEAFQAFLLRSYETVLFAEVDELIVADPNRYSGLDAYLDRLARPAARCVGFNVVHQAEEPPLRFDSPLLSQRRFWHASLKYSKRLVSRVPLRWSVGFHEEFNVPDDAPDPQLLLVHLHRIDYRTCFERHRTSASADWNAADLRNRLGSQNRIVDEDEFEEWFRNGPDLDAPRELIPDHIRSSF